MTIKIRKVLFLTFFIALLAGCSTSVKPVTSREMSSLEERISLLESYIQLSSPVEDVEFSLYDVNRGGSSRLPGASSRDYQIYLKVSPSNVELWLEGMSITSFPLDTQWAQDIIAHRDNLKWPEGFLTYTGENSLAFVQPEEGVLFLRFQQN